MFSNVTHLLCGSDFDEKDANEAFDIYDIPVVTGEWVRASIRLGRLACPKPYHPMSGGIFQSCVASIAQLNANDRKKLYALITFHGGRVERNFTPKTTHLVCGIATGTIYMKAMEMKSDKFCIITPDWFYECLKAQEPIDPKPYHPRLLKPGIPHATSGGGSSTDGRSLSSILGLDDLKIDLKKNEPRSKFAALNAAHSAASLSSASTTTAKTTAAANQLSTTNTATDDMRAKTESAKTKPSDTIKTTPKLLANQTNANQNRPLAEATNKERIVS